MIRNICLGMIFLLMGFSSSGQTIGLLQNEAGVEEGYILFAPLTYTSTYLIDNCGKLIHEWPSSYVAGMAAYLQDDGSIIRAGKTSDNEFADNRGGGGIIERIAPDGTVMWTLVLSDSVQLQHHDLEIMPNGNIMIIAWDKKTEAEAIAAGRNPALVEDEMWSDKLVEVNPLTGEVVWEWKAWDHLIQDFDPTKPNYGVIAEHPERINVNYEEQGFDVDWLHINSVDYNAELDQLAICPHDNDEIWIIDRSTSMTEAAGSVGGNAGMGGDLLYRWGNPAAYDMGTLEDKKLFGQHDVQWINDGLPFAGKILVYNNGNGRIGDDYSSIDIFTPPMSGTYNYNLPASGLYPPSNLDWTYEANNPTDFFSLILSGAQMQPNANVIICEGASGRLFEVNNFGNIVWEYINPVSLFGPGFQGTNVQNNSVFLVERILNDHPGLSFLDLTPGDPIEQNPIPYECLATTDVDELVWNELKYYPNPVNDELIIELEAPVESYAILSLEGSMLRTESRTFQNEIRLPTTDLANGLYLLRIEGHDRTDIIQFVVMH